MKVLITREVIAKVSCVVHFMLRGMPLSGGYQLSYVVNPNSAYYDRKRIAKKFTIYVVRDKECSNVFQESQPCISCEVDLKKIGFKKIIYSSRDGTIQKKKVIDLNTKHFSKAQKVLQENINIKMKKKQI